MAKSFHHLIKSGQIEISHQGQSVTVELPTWLTEASDILMDSEALLTWAYKNDMLLAHFHAAIQSEIIDIRAAGRPAVKADGSTKSIISDKANVQSRVSGFKPKPTEPPSESGKKTRLDLERDTLAKAIPPMLNSGMAIEDIITTFGNAFSSDLIREVFDSLNPDS